MSDVRDGRPGFTIAGDAFVREGAMGDDLTLICLKIKSS